MSMRNLFYFFSILIALSCISLDGYSQELTIKQKEEIISEITVLFEKSIKAAETIDVKMMADNVDASRLYHQRTFLLFL